MDFGVNKSWEDVSFWHFKGKEVFIDEWFLMSSPVPLLLITISYLMFALKLGPQYMKNRTPMNINNLLLLYNGLLVAVSTYIFFYGITHLGLQGLLPTKCAMNEQETRTIAYIVHIYHLAKVFELLDTVFFVLRKKYNQITFLHVYHHTSMTTITWLTLKYEPTYTTAFLGWVNCFVHIIMYTYYGLSTIPSMTKYLWWKKYITSMQLLQFVAVFLHASTNYAYSECPPSYTLLCTILFNSIVFIYLFTDFYVKAYFKNQRGISNGKYSIENNSNTEMYLNDTRKGTISKNE